jgi:hypothetical protein
VDSSNVLDLPTAGPNARDLALVHRSLNFMMDQVAGGIAGLSPRDALLVMAIKANIAPLTREAEARLHYGDLENPAPDAERRPVSISAIAGSLGLPFETVRRRIKHLESLGICITSGHGVIVTESFLASPEYLQSVVTAHNRLRAFYWELAGAGLLGPLPWSAFPVDGVVPVRAAARLLSDYILRASDHLMSVAGDVVSAMVLLGVLGPSTSLPPGTRPTPLVTLANRLSIPAETARRHAAHLVDLGLCVRRSTGLLVTPDILARANSATLLRENTADLRRMFAGLAERGVIDAWRILGPPAAAA